MRNKYWKYICLLGLGAFCWTCSDDNPTGPTVPALKVDRERNKKLYVPIK